LLNIGILFYLYARHIILFDIFNALEKIGRTYGLEQRQPFADMNIINLFNKLPWREKTKFFKRKHQVVTLGRKYLPAKFMNMQKEGFGVPLKEWFYEEKGLGRFIGLLSDRRTRERGVFEVNYLEKLLDEYQNRRLSDDSFECIIWPIINFELWNRVFVDKKLVGY
jgi:asparagine synthase (glutamine-hydrolysing)